MTNYNLNSAIQIINYYLFKGELPIELVRASLDVVSRSNRNRHLNLSGLENGLPEDTAKAAEALLRLCLLFEDEADPSPEIMKKLLGLRSIYQFIKGYLLHPVDPSHFEMRFNELNREYKCDEINIMTRALAYQLAMYDVSKMDDIEIQKVNIAAACSKLLGHLEQHWYSIIGCLC